MRLNSFSVLLPIYFKESSIFFEECLDSIANQSLQASEIVIVKDGPITYDLEKSIDKYSNLLPLKVVGTPKNQGLSSALNFGLNFCQNDLIIRMDADDICCKDRFKIQVEFMESNPSVAVCSSWVEERSNGMDNPGILKVLPEQHHEILKLSKWRNPINHPATILRKSCVIKAGGYPNIYPEDYALWSVMLVNGFLFYNIPKSLLLMRTNGDFYKRRGIKLLKGEFILLKFQFKIGLIGTTQLFINALLRLILRLSPNILKKFLYHTMR